MDNPFSWDYLTAPLSEMPTFGPFSIFYLALFGTTFLLAAFMYSDAPRRFSDHKLKRDTIRTGTQWMMWITGIGLLFFLVRVARFEFITMHMRIWLYLTFLAYIAVAAYIVYYLRTVYPAKLAAFEKHRERRKYHGPAAGRARPRKPEPARRNRQTR